MLHDEEIFNDNFQTQDSSELEQKTFSHTQTNSQSQAPKKRILRIPTQPAQVIKSQAMQNLTNTDSLLPQKPTQINTDTMQDSQPQNIDSQNSESQTNSLQQDSHHIAEPLQNDKQNNQQDDKQVDSIKQTTQDSLITTLKIQIENRIFSLNLENLNKPCQEKILNTFTQKQYSLEELLTMFVLALRDQTIAEIELLNLLHTLKS